MRKILPILFFSYLGFLTILLLKPGAGLYFEFLSFNWADKLVHLTLFAIFSFLFFSSFGTIKLINGVLVLSSYAAGTEILQEILPIDRSGDIMDFLFDGIGILLGFSLFIFIKRLLSPWFVVGENV